MIAREDSYSVMSGSASHIAEQAEHKEPSRHSSVPLYLWLATPKSFNTEAESTRILSSDENSRSRAFHFERSRREYLTSRLLVRNALSHYHPIHPRAWRFSKNSYGKPALDPDCGLRFNLSNSPGLVVCLLGREVEVGVDAEPLDRASHADSVRGEFLSDLEKAQLEGLCDEDKLDRTLTLWTLKESYIKARGLGLTLPLQRFSFVFDETDGIRLDLDPCLKDDSANWQFCLLNLNEHRIALCIQSKQHPQLEIWETHSIMASPKRRFEDEIRWFPRSY